MANNYTLDTQTRYLWVILGRKNSPLTQDFVYYYERLKRSLESDSELFAYIGHDKDIDDNGELKFKHIHLLCVLKNGMKPRLSTSLNRIANACELAPQDIDIEPAQDVGACIRYCLHKGYAEKHQYELSELQTNLSSEDLESYLNVDINNVTAGYLITCCKVCGKSYIEVLKSLGLKYYMKYRNVIRDIIEEFKTQDNND